jgi:hypothetical protein
MISVSTGHLKVNAKERDTRLNFPPRFKLQKKSALEDISFMTAGVQKIYGSAYKKGDLGQFEPWKMAPEQGFPVSVSR